MFPRAPDRVTAADRYEAGPTLSLYGPVERKEETFMPDITADTADIDDPIAIAKETVASLLPVLQTMILVANILAIRKRGLNF